MLCMSRLVLLAFLPLTLMAQDPVLSVLGTYRTGSYNVGAAEIAAHDPQTQRLFVVNGADKVIDILDMRNPANMTRVGRISFTPEIGAAANSVAVKNGIVAVAVEADPKTSPGSVAFYNAEGRLLKSLKVGALPDMITFSPDGRKVLTANEGEPSDDYTVDPEGSISIIDISKGIEVLTQDDVKTADFRSFTRENLPAGVRVFGPRASVAQDLEPEYITLSPDSKTAYVTVQEANAIAIVDVDTARVTRIAPLGLKPHFIPENSLDASDRDNAFDMRTWTVWGMYQPDAIASYVASDGRLYLLTANEGDARDWPGYTELARVGANNVRLDPRVYPNEAELKLPSELGRLNITTASGDTDGDGDLDQIHVFGSRSFSVWDANINQIYDSKNDFEKIQSTDYPGFHNPGHTNNTPDDRSDDKGPEPEGVTTGVIRGRTYAFISNERLGNIMVYDVTDARAVRFTSQWWNRNPTAATNSAAAGDLGPEGILYIPATESPNGRPLLVVANEISGTTTVWQVN
jgi:2',3'-cyclic-nucleotide 2'-phosphodiesterase / 3'-nucleotidase / 5'-nucleotidase